ncbi:response regulator transcription factor [Candidatus Riflebacteria bacterium]
MIFYIVNRGNSLKNKGGREIKALIIEDNEFIQEQMTLILEAKNHETKSVMDGAAGLEQIKEFEPDVILCDLMMPGMNGFDFIKTYRQESMGSKPVIAMTAILGARGVSKESLLEMGFDEVVTKPFDFDEFIKLIESFAQV